MPKWNPTNLTRHHAKHPGGKDKFCWQDLLGVNGRAVSEAEYEKESLAVCRHRWLEFEAETVDREHVAAALRSGQSVPYHPRRRYNIDDRLVTTIVAPTNDAVVTCFHEHFDRRHETRSHKRPTGELRARYKNRLENLEMSGMMRRMKRIHDES